MPGSAVAVAGGMDDHIQMLAAQLSAQVSTAATTIYVMTHTGLAQDAEGGAPSWDFVQQNANTVSPPNFNATAVLAYCS
jgi:hypothetical protein